MYVVIKIVDIEPVDILCLQLTHLADNWYMARFEYGRELFVVVCDVYVDFIVWRNETVIRYARAMTDNSNSEFVCLKVDYSFFIENLRFDEYFDNNNTENIINHLLENVQSTN